MSQGTEKKWRKLYLGLDNPFIIPRSTLLYSQQFNASDSQSPRSTKDAAIPCTAANDASDDSGTPQSSPDEQWPKDGSSAGCAADYSDDNAPSTCPNGDSHLESSSDGCLDSLAHEMISDGEARS